MMTSNKTATLTLRLDPTLKEALRNAAEQEHRSLANMVEVMILDYCGRHGHAVPNAAEETKRGEQSKGTSIFDLSRSRRAGSAA